MKILSYTLVMIGFATAIVSIWFTSYQMRNDITRKLDSLRPVGLVSTNSHPDARALRQSALRAREQVNRALSDLRSIKTSMVVRSQTARNQAAASLEEARRSISELSILAEQMNSIALKVENDAREVIVEYETALNQAIDEATAAQKLKSTFGVENVIAILGASVSVFGLFLSWRSDITERTKKSLEIEELRRKLAVIPSANKS